MRLISLSLLLATVFFSGCMLSDHYSPNGPVDEPYSLTIVNNSLGRADIAIGHERSITIDAEDSVVVQYDDDPGRVSISGSIVAVNDCHQRIGYSIPVYGSVYLSSYGGTRYVVNSDQSYFHLSITNNTAHSIDYVKVNYQDCEETVVDVYIPAFSSRTVLGYYPGNQNTLVYAHFLSGYPSAKLWRQGSDFYLSNRSNQRVYLTVGSESHGFDFTFHNDAPYKTEVTIDHETRTVGSGASTVYHFSYRPESIRVEAESAARTESGNLLGLAMSVDEVVDVGSSSSLRYNFYIPEDYFFLSVKNNSYDADFDQFRVNYNHSNEQIENVSIPPNGITYPLGYYDAHYSTTYVYGRIEQWDIPNKLWSFTLPMVDNQTKTIVYSN